MGLCLILKKTIKLFNKIMANYLVSEKQKIMNIFTWANSNNISDKVIPRNEDDLLKLTV